LLSVIQAISTIRKGRKKRTVQKEDSKGAKLKNLEDSIANLDNLQGSAVIETVDGVQRIRGLAGSGKTIVLALKASYLHAQHVDWKIAVTFHTRSLKGQFRQLINTFTIEQTNEEPEWDNLNIIHAWGAPGGVNQLGLYYLFCQRHGLECLDFKSAREKFGTGHEFEGACQKALDEASKTTEGVFDAILIDEAQDFPPSFLRLCYELLKPEKRLVYAYDELQNLGSLSLPSPEEIFGKNDDGTPQVQFAPIEPGKPQQDIILKKCYRNSRPLLATAHALGFGIYRTPDQTISRLIGREDLGLIQIFDNKQLWIDIGYSVADGLLEEGHEVTLQRTEESSPVFLESHSSIDDLIQFRCFSSMKDQIEWVANAIQQNLSEDELRPDDIIVINPDPLTTRSLVGPIRKMLFEKGINSHLAGVDTAPDIFFNTDIDSIVFTGIYRAKGNEAGMVYIINAQDCYSSYGNLRGVRNRLFTAITRSKGWVRVLGVGSQMQRLIDEYNNIQKNGFKLKFRYPTDEERQHIAIINRDMTAEEKRRVEKNQASLQTLLKDLESGIVHREDLGKEQITRLLDILTKEDK
jgi:superfamily I DNA and RNA helicase